jgi:hypothetical protein
MPVGARGCKPRRSFAGTSPIREASCHLRRLPRMPSSNLPINLGWARPVAPHNRTLGLRVKQETPLINLNWDRLSHLRGWPAVGWGVPVRVGGLQALWQPFLQPVPPSERRQSAPAAVVVAADPAKPGPAASKSITPAGGVGGIAPPSPQRCNRKPNGYIIRIQEGRPQDRPASLGRL